MPGIDKGVYQGAPDGAGAPSDKDAHDPEATRAGGEPPLWQDG